MAQTPEHKVKAKVLAILKKHDIWHFAPAANGYGRAGIPDILACLAGQFIAIECKAGRNKPTALQVREIEAIRHNGGIAWVVNETNVELAEEALTRLKTSGTT